jgi:eukaryotic-like serine/threonine-protein kinase
MTPERWSRVKSVFQRAYELDASARAAFVEAECAGDAALLDDVMRLIAAERDSGSLEQSAIEHLPDIDLARAKRRWIGRVAGPYRMVEMLGEGGMGEVYRALRDDGEFNKAVAIKLVRGGQDSEHVLARFKAERRILATLEHPNIARLIDTGATDEGVPYLVMELVEGEPIDSYCTRLKLPVAERLALFRTVCAAVQYAHQRLVVHRDLKPGNILVTADGTIKLLDFGIAKLVDEDGVDARTMTAQRILTPEYASPEQVRGFVVTTASDIYSLGVVLFRLLTGQSPYGKTVSPHELIRAICETDSTRPSVVLRKTTLPAEQGEASRNARLVSGDLDNIVLMALRKEPERRYASAAEFADDIGRFLAGLPVRAHEDTFAYRARKFVARHKLATAATVLTAFALAASSVITWRQAVVARAERERAERHFGDVRKLVNSFLFEVHDAVQDLPGSIPARKLLVQNALSYLDVLSREAAHDPVLKRELAIAYRKVGDLQGRGGRPNTGDGKGAVDSYTKAIALFDELLARDAGDAETSLEMAEALKERAWVHFLRSNDEQAGQDIRRAVELGTALYVRAPNDPRVLATLADAEVALAWTLDRKGDSAGAIALVEKALAKFERVTQGGTMDGPLSVKYGGAYHTLAQFLTRDQVGRKYREALDVMQKALAIHRPLADKNPGDAIALTGVAHDHRLIGMLNMSLGESAPAVAAFRVAIDYYARAARIDPSGLELRPSRLDLLLRYAEALEAQGEFAEAMKTTAETLDTAIAWQARTDVSSLKIIAARAQAALGRLHLARAKNVRLPAAERLDHWRKAESWYAAADLAYAVLVEKKFIPLQDQHEPGSVAEKLKEVRQGLRAAGG